MTQENGRAGPKLLAHVLFAKYGLHLPLNRQSDVYEREGIDLDVSTLADWVGAAAATLMPLVDVIRAHVFTAERIHAETPQYRSWPRARPESADYRPMCAMTARSPVPIRRRPCSSIRVIAAASILINTWRATPD